MVVSATRTLKGAAATLNAAATANRQGNITRWSLSSVLRWTFAACAALVWSVQVHALGLGDIEVNSALNQPLDADISLLSVKPDEVSRINVRLADDIAYLTSGVEKTALINQLVFAVTEQSGDVIVKVSTREPIKEPFLDFIIEVNWPSGRLLREYTVLLDPPVFAGESASAVTAPQAEPPVATPAPTPSRASRPAAGASRGADASGTATQRAPAAPAPSTGSADAGALASETTTTPNATTGEYGPVGRSETLGTIAKQVRPGDQYSLEQVMMALYRANPDAFFDENINNLRAGAVLRTPTEQAIADVSQSRAVQEAREHYRRWLDARRKKSAAGGEAGGTEAGLAAMGSSDPGGGKRASSATTESDGQLRLLSPEDAAVTGRGGDGTGTDGSAFADLTELDGLEKRELQDRIVALESELQKMQRLVTLKDDLLTQFQSRATNDSEFGATPEQSPVDNASVESLPQESAMGEMTAQPDTADQNQPTPNEANAGTPPPAIHEDNVPAGAATDQAATDDDHASTEESWTSMLMNPQILALLVGLLLLLGAGGWMMARRRRQAAEEYELPYVADEPAVKLPSAAELAQRSQPVPAVAAQGMTPSFAGSEEFGAGGLEALETDESEIDPVAEADVYLAYRRFQQAEELIREALRKEPDRQDLQLKMLEIYFGSGNKEAFEAQAEALYAMLGGEDNETWQRVMDMGQELCPDHPLFSGAAAPSGASGHTYAAQAGLSAGAAATATAAGGDFSAMWDTADSGFNSAAIGSNPEQRISNQGSDGDIDNPFASLNFETGLGQGSTVKPSGRQEVAQAGMADLGQDGGLDFDLSGFDFDKLGSTSDDSPLARDDAAMFANNFSTAEQSGVDDQPGRREGFANAAGAGPDDFAHLISGSQGEVEEVFTGLDDGAEGEDLFAGSDMVGTKLDLARAYIDMDDRDGARNILHEVIEEGNDTQKAEAQELIKKIG